jgi:hypothetical protein
MPVSQSQVDHILSSASADDPEVKLANLEREVDLIKTSIKRLLMDIRERMNELENPFTIAASAALAKPGEAAAAGSEGAEAREAALEAREAALEAKETKLELDRKEKEEKKEKPAPTEVKPVPPEPLIPAILAAGAGKQAPQQISSEKLRLHKVYRLFKWTSQAVKKYGHDRLEVMLDSFLSLGYITKESCTEVKEIARLMPANLGEEHEVSPDEYVAELYALNRILSPTDTSLDRDMIEVLMERRGQGGIALESAAEKLLKEEESRFTGKKPAKPGGKTDELMNLLDRI